MRMQKSGGAYVADTAVVVGDVDLGEDTSVWFSTVVRGDIAAITIGARTNVQDGAVVHGEPDEPIEIGDDVIIGHNAVVHCTRIGDRCLVGIGAIVLGGVVVGDESIIGAGAVVAPGSDIPPRSMVLGVPGKTVRKVTDEEVADIVRNAAGYVTVARNYLP